MSSCLTLVELRNVVELAVQSVCASQAAHAPVKKAMENFSETMQLDASSSLHNLVAQALTPFTKVTHEPFDTMGIEDQLKELEKSELISAHPRALQLQDLVITASLIIIFLNEGKPHMDQYTNAQKDNIAKTTLLVLEMFKGAHRARAFDAHQWITVVARDLGVRSLPSGIIAQCGFSQGFERNRSARRSLRDLDDLRDLNSSLEWVSVRMLAFPVICRDKSRRTLGNVISICSMIHHSGLMMDVSPDLGKPNKSLIGYMLSKDSDIMAEHKEFDLGEWQAHIERCSKLNTMKRQRSASVFPETKAAQ